MKVSKSMFSKVSKSALSILLSITMVISILPSVSAKAADTSGESYPYVVFTSNCGNSLDFCKSNLTVNGDIHSNGKLTINAGNANINGECGAVEGIDKGQGNFNVRKQVPNPETVDMISIPNKVKTTYFTNNCDTINDSYTKSDVNVNLNRSVYAEKDVHLSGNISLNCCVGSSGNIILDGNTLNSNNTVLYSEKGDITINNDNATVNGLIYAPNGKVIVKGQNFQVNGTIIAKEVKIDSGNVNINRNDSVAKFIGNTSENNTQSILYAYGEYDKDSNAINIRWESTVKDGKFDIMASTNGYTYNMMLELSNTYTYSYSIIGTPDKLYFKVRQTLKDGKTVESNPFVMVKTESGYKLQDTDGDGLPDIYEKWLGTDPQKADTDGDGLNDYQEIYLTSTDPLKADTDGNGISDANEDLDKDGLTNVEEIKLGTGPLIADTDGDSLKDGEEANTYKTNPQKYDTDDDGISDGDEVKQGLNPNTKDTDGNGVEDGDEIASTVYTGDDFGVTGNDVEISIELSASRKELSTFRIEQSNNNFLKSSIPGYLGNAYDLYIDGTFKSANITMTFDDSLLANNSFKPTIYYYNEKSQMLEEVENQTVNGNKVSAPLKHFSTYILLNKTDYEKVWDTDIKLPSEKTSSNLDIVFNLDISESMDYNDSQNIRQTLTNAFIDKLSDKDRAAVVTFRRISATLNQGKFAQTSDEKNSLKSEVSSIVNDDGHNSYSGTNGSAGLYNAINLFDNRKSSTSKYIIFVTDGDDNYSSYNYDDLIKTAQNSNIAVYTIGLGSSTDEENLKKIANETGGKYYHADVANDLIENFDFIQGETIDYTTDSNQDGISDYYTKLICDGKLVSGTGSNVFDGKTYNEIQANSDCDGDGLKNGDEVKVVAADNGRVYLWVNSSPVMADTDEDGLTDANDTSPLTWNVCDRDLAMFAALTYEEPDAYTSGKIVGNLKEDVPEPGLPYYFLQFVQQAELDTQREHWKIVNFTRKWAGFDSDFEATTYKNGKSLVISIRGTDEDIGEWVNNIVGYGICNWQTEEGFAEVYASMMAKKYPDCNIYITGHSLGGYLTQFAASQLYWDGKMGKVKKAVYFNGMGLDFNPLGINSLGIIDNSKVKTGLSAYNKENKLILYRIDGDVVSALGHHMGQTVSFEPAKEAIENHANRHGNTIIPKFDPMYLTNPILMEAYELAVEDAGKNILVRRIWYTHETDSFLKYLTQGTRVPEGD